MATKYNGDTTVIVDKLYPLVAKSMATNSNKVKQAVQKFFQENSEQIYDIAPFDNILYTKTDIDNLFKAIGMTEEQVCDIMKDCFYWDIPYNPQAAKEPYVLVSICIMKYYLIQGKDKDAEMMGVYLAFSGKFYASIFAGVAFPKAPPSKYRAVMEYVVNNMLTNKFILKEKGTMFAAVQALVQTWINFYKSDLKGKQTDEEIGKMIQQLRDRVKSFLMNIAKQYNKAYEEKLYLNYETQNETQEEFRLTDNDSLRATRYTEATVSYIMTHAVSLEICQKCKDENVSATEIKAIMEAICGNKSNINEIYRVVNILICDFMRYYPDKSVGSVDFIAHSIKPKPNTKDKYIIELQNIIIKWLTDNSVNYRRRRKRPATDASYRRSVTLYITLIICKATK
jgi:hypothetical protein